MNLLVKLQATRLLIAGLRKQAVDWAKLMSDPAYMERLKKKMEEQKSEPSSKSSPGGFRPKKKREDMSLEEVAVDEQKAQERDMEKAKAKQGKLHLNEEQAAIVKKMVEFVMAAPLESMSFRKQKQIIQSILQGHNFRGQYTPGWERTLANGDKIWVLTQSQLSLINAIYSNVQEELTKEKEPKMMSLTKDKGEVVDKGKWQKVIEKQREQRNKRLFEQKGLKYPSSDDDVLDLEDE